MKIGFLGAGAMGGAILSGALESGFLKPEDVYVSEYSQLIKEKYAAIGCNIVSSNKELGEAADIIVFAVKPQHAKVALAELEGSVDGKACMSIMAGLTNATIRKYTEGNFRLLRIMPNTPALVSAGVFACCSDTDFTEDEKAFAEQLLGTLGICEWMSEELLNTATGLSGAGPAYVYMFIEALADGGVMEGLPRATAQRLAAQTVLGAAKMVLETGDHPGLLKDRVCSPGGNTIVGVKTLEEHGFRAACIDTVSNSTKKARELGNN